MRSKLIAGAGLATMLLGFAATSPAYALCDETCKSGLISQITNGQASNINGLIGFRDSFVTSFQNNPANKGKNPFLAFSAGLLNNTGLGTQVLTAFSESSPVLFKSLQQLYASAGITLK